jgi:periplasmic divalent cation tolerance protein
MPAATEKYQLVLTTAGSDAQATSLARELVERRVAACVNVLGPICSYYRWKGEITHDEERLLLIKTTAARFDELAAAIRELHTYDVPEIIAIPIDDGDSRYLKWISDNVEKTRD